MIARISGTLVHKSPAYLIVDAHGVGYRIFIPLTTFYDIPDLGQPVTLNVHTQVKQDGINLFGFYTSAEREIFQLLLGVNGIGPKLALNVLSGIAAGELIRALAEGNLKRLIGIPGVGKKMAERIILELRDKAVKLLDQDIASHVRTTLPAADLREDALSALTNLGYKSPVAGEVLDNVIRQSPEGLTLDLLLKGALKALSG
jgi:Holliday junction DNA helicase RuvA